MYSAIVFGTCFLVHAIDLSIGESDSARESEERDDPTKPVEVSAFGKYRAAAVASDAPICSQIGSDVIILQGGSAVDAAIATLLCDGLANSHSMGIGGGFVMTFYNSTSQTAETLIAREKAPLAATADMFAPDNGISSLIDGRLMHSMDDMYTSNTFSARLVVTSGFPRLSGFECTGDGGKAVGVPGEIAGYWEAHQRYGRLPWRDLFEPSIKLAREGIPIGKGLANAIDVLSDSFDIYPQLKTWFLDEEKGTIKKEGDTFTRPKIADTLELIANGDRETYYGGSLADDIVADISDADGIITKDDLEQYQADWRTPVTLDFGDGMNVYSVPPPASGAVFEYILNILDGYNFKPSDIRHSEEAAILTYHRTIEAMKFAFAKRTGLGDADFVDVQELLENMTSNDFGEFIRQQIDDSMTRDTAFYGPTFLDSNTAGTAHISVLDKDGNAVAVTSTVNTFFGSKVIGERTGIIFNSQMDDFSTPGVTNVFGVEPSPANFIEPGKRPLSSMCPSIIVDANGEVELVVGASGGTKITTSSALVTLYTLKFGMDVNEAIDERRIHHQLLPEELKVEEGFSEVYLYGLRRKGHIIEKETPGSSVVQAILRKNSEIQACSDWRKRGAPFGY